MRPVCLNSRTGSLSVNWFLKSRTARGTAEGAIKPQSKRALEQVKHGRDGDQNAEPDGDLLLYLFRSPSVWSLAPTADRGQPSRDRVALFLRQGADAHLLGGERFEAIFEADVQPAFNRHDPQPRLRCNGRRVHAITKVRERAQPLAHAVPEFAPIALPQHVSRLRQAFQPTPPFFFDRADRE